MQERRIHAVVNERQIVTASDDQLVQAVATSPLGGLDRALLVHNLAFPKAAKRSASGRGEAGPRLATDVAISTRALTIGDAAETTYVSMSLP